MAQTCTHTGKRGRTTQGWPLACLLSFLVSLMCAGAVFGAVSTHGTRITNTASVVSLEYPLPSEASATITVRIPSPPRIEFLQYSPTLPGAEQIPVALGAYRPGSDPLLPFIPLPPPRMCGSATPIDLSVPVPLTPAVQYHQGDPVFVRVTDLSMNLDPAVREVLFTTITVPMTGDIEIVRVTETGPNTGIFVGYTPSDNLNGIQYSGVLQLKEECRINASYTNPFEGTTVATTIMVDPNGIVFDTATALPVTGASITLINTATNQPAQVFGDDGASSYPATVTSGGSATDSSGKVYTFTPGGYRFPFVFPGVYRLDVRPPTGYTGPSTVDTATLQALQGGQFIIVTGSRGEPFPINPGPAVRIDVPLDPASAQLWVTKSAGREVAAPGEFVSYDLTVGNNSTVVPTTNVRLFDMLPTGFRLKKGSVQINGKSSPDPAISADGQTLTFTLGDLLPSSSVTVRFVAEITAGSRLGTAVNLASAISGGGGTSNIARATVQVRDDLLRTKTILMGRVTSGDCPADGEEPKEGVEGVRMYLEDGTFVISDKQGLFHFEGVRPGLHVVQLDLDSLPDGYQAVSCSDNSRFAGRAFSQFVEVQGGSLWRVDFHAKAAPSRQPEQAVMPSPQPAAQPEPPAAPVKGHVSLELASRPEGTEIVYTAVIRGGTVPVRDLHLNIEIPDCTIYRSGSSAVDGRSLPDPRKSGATSLTWDLGDIAGEWERTLTFRTATSAACNRDELSSRGYLAFVTPQGTKGLIAPAETRLQQVVTSTQHQMPDIVIRPHFPTFGAELDPEDKARLDELALLLKRLRTERIHVTGHTDNMPISHRSRKVYKDNVELSWARARSVGAYLRGALGLPPEKLTIDGKGESVPVASNKDQAGRALNRRVEVRAVSSNVVSRSLLTATRETSGVLKLETEGEAPEGTAVSSTRATPSASTTVATQAAPLPAGGAVPPQRGPVTETGTVPVARVAEASAGRPDASVPSRILAASVRPADGLMSPVDGAVLIDRINSVQARLDSSLAPKLFVDGVELPADKIGYRSVDQQTGKTVYSFIGVDFGVKGRHTVELKGMDPFGNQRFASKAEVVRTGEIARIRQVDFDDNRADGKTPVKVRVELYDDAGTLLKGATRLQYRDGTLRPYLPEKLNLPLDDKSAASMVAVDKDGWILFQPVNASGMQRAMIGDGKAVLEIETNVKPMKRDWILVGLAEGALGYNAVSGNMETLKNDDVKDDFYQDGRVAFFAKGQIKGEWLLTASYDTAKSKGEVGGSLFQQIDPDSYYTLYGDATQQQYDGASARKLYVRVERDQFYAMFGDFDTGLTVTELSRYSRRMTGARTEYQGKRLEVTAFAAETTQTYRRDEIPGDGTSGLYRLSGRNLLINSEKVTIMVRDRYRSEIVLSSKSLSRFVDYSIDFDAGTLFFKMPIPSKDENFNPVTILVEYETAVNAGRDFTYGGRVGIKLPDRRGKAGFSYIHEGLGARSNDLYGVDTTIQLGETTRFRGEAAYSESLQPGSTSSGYSYLAELLHTSKRFDAKAYVREQQGNFGLGQQMGSETATRKFGVDAAYRLTDAFTIGGSANRQTNLANGAERDVAEMRATYGTKLYGVNLGLLHAHDRLNDGRSMNSGQMVLGGKVVTLKERLTLSLDHAQSVWGNNNVDFPTRTTIGAEYKINEAVALFGAQEFTWGSTAETNATRLGIKSTPWKGASVTSSIERQMGENSSRLFATAGLRQTWQLTEEWKIDAGLDRSQTIKKQTYYLLNRNVQSATGNSEDFTAVSAGATYLVKGLTWDSRFEYRTSTSEDKWGILSGVVKEQHAGWAWSARGQYFQTEASGGLESRRANIRFGLVYRPVQTRWIHLNRFDIINEFQRGGQVVPSDSWRLVNNYNLNYKVRKNLQATLKYGAKYVVDTIAGGRYSLFTDHTGIEARYDISSIWDVGVRGSVLHTWGSGQLSYSCGVSVGYNLFENTWVSLGYNVWGFSDKDFSAADYTAQGPYIRFRMKFDQQTVKDAAGWLTK